MYYYGYFRSLDTSEDPQGQQYKVIILTGWNGGNPYPYKTIQHNGSNVSVPDFDKHIELQLTSHPFTVEYPQMEDIVTGGLRCSSARVSFTQEQFLPDFLSSNGTQTIVALLKRINNVKLAGSSYGGNPYHDYRLYKTQFGNAAWVGFLPEELDGYLYTTEWIGFASPEAYNMSYSHIFDSFTLEAQDVLSTLKYKKFNKTGVMTNFFEYLTDTLSGLGGLIKHIYLTDTVHFPLTTTNSWHGNIFPDLFMQQQNNVDESDEPKEKEDVINDMLRYAGLVAFQWGNEFYLTTPYAISRGYSNYKCYEVMDNSYVCCRLVQTNNYYTTFRPGPSRSLLVRYHLGEDKFKGDDSNISANNVFSKTHCICDLYRPSKLIPNISDIKDLGGIRWPTTTTSKERWNRRTSGGVDATDADYWMYWETIHWFVNNDDIKCFRYKEIVNTSDYWSNTPISPDTTDEHYNLYIDNYNSSMILDDGGLKHVSYNGQTPNKFSPQRTIYFITPYRDYHDDRHSRGYDNKANYALPMFYMRTPEIVVNGDMYLRIKGNWTFYRSAWVGTSGVPDTAYGEDVGDYNKCQYRWTTAKVKFGNKWLANTSQGTYNSAYTWSDTEQWVRLWLYGDSSMKPYGVAYEYVNNYRGIDGAIIKLPVPAGEAVVSRIEITFDKPLGVGRYVSTCATLQNFDIDILSSRYVNEGKDGIEPEDEDGNVKYETDIVEGATEEHGGIGLDCSTTWDKGFTYSTLYRAKNMNEQVNFKTIDNVYNAASGLFCVPEKHAINLLAEQHRTPNIGFEATVYKTNEVVPYLVMDWSHLPNRLFVVNGMTIDYEYEEANINFTEVKSQTERIVSRGNITRNFRRNNDNLVRADSITPEVEPLENVQYTHDNTRSVVVNDGRVTMETDSEPEGLIMFSPSISQEDGRLLVSIPNVMDRNILTQQASYQNNQLVQVAKDSNTGHIKLYMDGSVPPSDPVIPPIDPVVPPIPVGPIDPDFPILPADEPSL